MRFIIALLLPWLLFFTIGRPIAALICLALQISLIGWLPAAIWAVYSLSQYNTDKKIAALKGGTPAGEIAEAKAAFKFITRQIKRLFGGGAI